MGRGTARRVDTMLIVADSSLKSLEIAKKIHGLATEAGIKNPFMVGNKVRDSSEEELIQQFAAKNKISMLDLVPHDEKILKADREGETPLKYAEASNGIAAIQRIGEKILKHKI
jgi:CO dehydrogenase maturation factor